MKSALVQLILAVAVAMAAPLNHGHVEKRVADVDDEVAQAGHLAVTTNSFWDNSAASDKAVVAEYEALVEKKE